MPDTKRRECVWCDEHHPMDGGGPITREDREAGRVVTGLCPAAKDRVTAELGELPEISEAQERAALQRYADAPLHEDEYDEAGIERRVIPNERVLLVVVAVTAGLVALGFILAKVL